MSAGWRSRLVRRGVEALSWAKAILRPKLRRCRTGRSRWSEPVGCVQSLGTTIYRRELQADFPPAGIECPGQWPETHLYRISDARVSGVCGSIFLPDGELFSVCPWVEMLTDRRVRRPSWLFEHRLDGPVLHLLGRNHENHGHFLFEYLPRILAAEPWLQGREGLRIGITGRFSHWQRRYLELLGYRGDKVVEFWPGTTRVTELFFVPRLSGRSSMPAPALMKATIERLQAGARVLVPDIAAPPDPARVVFVSRQDAPNKKLLNETELVNSLRRVFPVVETVVLSQLSFVQQLKTMARAAVIVGPQGMGLSNMAFLKDRLLVCLEAGHPPPEMAWEAAYCLVAESGGNPQSCGEQTHFLSEFIRRINVITTYFYSF